MTDERLHPSRPVCGVGVVAFHEDAVLLVRRDKEPRRGEWSIPGGAVELGERVRDAAVREFEEECGSTITLQELVDVVDIITRDSSGRIEYDYVVIDFWAEWEDGVIKPATDVSEARWVVPAELDSYALPSFTRSVIDKALASRKARALQSTAN